MHARLSVIYHRHVGETTIVIYFVALFGTRSTDPRSYRDAG